MIKSRRAILALLTALNLINYIDRFVVMAVSTRIKEDLHLTDFQIGAVTSVFMFGYFLTSPIFGWLGDRYPRKHLIAAGVVIWSLATAVSGLAGTLAGMLVARIAVGVGEASYATLSPTIIDDIATKDQKNRWLSIFYVAIPLGSALGFLLGGFIEHRWGWRMAFFVAGGPGVVLALATLLIDEPKHVRKERAEDEKASKSGSFAALAKNPLYVSVVAGYVAQTFALGGFTAWAAPFLYRKLCLELDSADFYFGAITAVTGIVGTALGGWLSGLSKSEDRTRVCLRVCAYSSMIAAPLALLSLFMPSAFGFFLVLGACELAIFASVLPTNAAVLVSVPLGLRASAMAVSIFFIHLLGDLISPPIIGALSDAFGDKADKCSGGGGLQLGMYLLPAALALSALFWWRGATAKLGASAPGQLV